MRSNWVGHCRGVYVSPASFLFGSCQFEKRIRGVVTIWQWIRVRAEGVIGMSENNHSNDTNSGRPTVIRPGESDFFDWGGAGVEFKIDGSDTGGTFAIAHHPIAPRTLVAPLHRHRNEDEYSFVLEGTMGALLGDDVVEAGAGSWVFKPRDEWHTFWNAGDTPCHLIEVISPGGMEDAFRDWREVGEDVEQSKKIDEKYGIETDYESVPDLCDRFDLRPPQDAELPARFYGDSS